MGNLHVPENRFSENEMWCVTDNHSDMCHTRAKGFLDLKLN